MNAAPNPQDLIPAPSSWTPAGGACALDEGIALKTEGPGAERAERYLRERLGSALKPAGRAVRLIARDGDGEDYRLAIAPGGITVEGAPRGLLYGAVTLQRLLIDDAGGLRAALACGTIEDRPAYAWRGMMLDASPPFLSLEYLKHAAGLMLELKLNRLHLHLFDDQGWRMEIAAYPDLTRVGASVERGERQTGFYTQAQMRELVAYCAERNIEIVPEFEVPGHAFASVASYPWLCCTGKPERTATGHQTDLYCAGKASTFTFLEKVLDELIGVFPFQYLHLGGDEAPKARWKDCPACRERMRAEGLKDEEALQAWMFSRLAAYLKARGRTAIGWDEIVEGKPDRAILVQWWRYRGQEERYLREALAAGYRVIASPNSFCYLSFPVAPNEHFKPARTSDLPKAYSVVYAPENLPAEARARVLGAECCVWTEHLVEEQIDAMLFPRVLASSELMWAAPAAKDRDYDAFRERVYASEAYWKRLGVTFGAERSPPQPA